MDGGRMRGNCKRLRIWRKLTRAMTACLLALSAGCATTGPPVSVPQVLQMSHQGIPPDTIIARMRQTDSVYQLPASQLVALGEAGVPGPVLDYMQQTRFNAVSKRAAREHYFETRMLNSWR
jgi:hypothetical protein